MLQGAFLGEHVVVALAIMLLSSASLPLHIQEKTLNFIILQQFSIVFCSVGFLQEILKLQSAKIPFSTASH